MSYSERDTQIRQQDSPNELHLEEPYYVLTKTDEYTYREYVNATTPKTIIGEKDEEKVENFPACITHYYWIYEGKNDEEHWRALFKYYDVNTKRERYGFFVAYCDYTGFDCQGDIKLYVSDQYNILINKALDDGDYKLYIDFTSPTL